MADSLKSKTVKGTLWSSLERFSVQGIQFVVMIIMARILTPQDYGLVGMITLFIGISQTLIDSGFSQALIRKQDRNETDNSTVFYFNIAVGIALYFVLFISAPLIARFYDEPLLIPITRVVALGLVFNSLAVVQRALLTLKLDFKTQAKATLIGAVLSGVVGIYMAMSGFGVWSIVFNLIVNYGTVTFLLWVFSHWKPQWVYSWQSFKELFSFGSKLLASGLLETLYRNMYLLVIGKVFNASDLGYYSRAHQFSDFASSNVSGIFQRVSYPVLCTIQNDDNRLADVYRRLLRTSAFIIFPLMIGLASLSKVVIITFLTEKWLFASTLLVPLCLSGMWYPVHALNLNLLQVKGRSDLYLRLEIIKKLVAVIIFCCALPFGLVILCWSSLASSLFALIINTYYTGKLINIGFLKQIADLTPTLILSGTMGVIIYLFTLYTTLSSALTMCIDIIAGIVFYISLAKIFKFSEFKELYSILRKSENR